MSVSGVYGNYYGMNYPNYSYRYQQPYNYQTPKQEEVKPKKEKVGFFEGIGHFLKGVVRPIKNMIKHPIKSALFIAAGAALVIGTGGAATPFLIAAGLAMGGYQVAKGTYNAITSDNKEDTIAALENMGEGTFTVGASLVGAKSYASSTSAGSAAASKLAAAKSAGAGACGKTWAYTKGLAADTWNVVRQAPESAKTTMAMIKSGEVSANFQSIYGSAKLAHQHRNLAKMKADGRADTLRYKFAKQKYEGNLTKYGDAMTAKMDKILGNYAEMINKNLAAEKNTKTFENAVTRLIDNGFVRTGSQKAFLKHINPLNNTPEETLGIAIASRFGNENEDEFVNNFETYAPAVI